jgi:hypothetical protein
MARADHRRRRHTVGLRSTENVTIDRGASKLSASARQGTPGRDRGRPGVVHQRMPLSPTANGRVIKRMRLERNARSRRSRHRCEPRPELLAALGGGPVVHPAQEDQQRGRRDPEPADSARRIQRDSRAEPTPRQLGLCDKPLSDGRQGRRAAVGPAHHPDPSAVEVRSRSEVGQRAERVKRPIAYCRRPGAPRADLRHLSGPQAVGDERRVSLLREPGRPNRRNSSRYRRSRGRGPPPGTVLTLRGGTVWREA